MKHSLTFLFLLSASSVHGAVATFNGSTDNDYNTSTNWNTGTVPTTGDRAFVPGGQSVTLSSTVTGTPDDAIYGQGGTGTASVTFEIGASASYVGAVSIGRNVEGIFTMNDGVLISSALGIGAYNDLGFGGTLNMNGGIINTGTVQSTFDSATLNLSGGTMNLSNGINLNANALADGTEINWDFSSGSSTEINITGGALLALRDSSLTFDLTGLGNGTYTLINNGGNGTINHTGTTTFNNLGPGLVASINSTGNALGDDFVLTVIPEPSSSLLLALSVFSLLGRRRR